MSNMWRTPGSGEKEQPTIPKQYRDELGLETGAPVAVLRVGDALSWSQSRIASGSSANPSHLFSSAMNSTPEDLLETLPQARDRVYARRYPALAGPARSGTRRRSKER